MRMALLSLLFLIATGVVVPRIALAVCDTDQGNCDDICGSAGPCLDCGGGNYCCGTCTGVPEFSALQLIYLLAGTGGGSLYVIRRARKRKRL